MANDGIKLTKLQFIKNVVVFLCCGCGCGRWCCCCYVYLWRFVLICAMSDDDKAPPQTSI